jgi:hypothetical protein
MTMHSTFLRDQVADLLGTFDVARLEPFLTDVERFYAPDVYFKDPMQERRGITEFLEMNRGLARAARSIRFDVIDRIGDDERFALRWWMTMRPKFGPQVRIEGVSHLRGRGGLVIEHRDFWDVGELIACAIPGGQSVLRALYKPFTG